MFSRKIICLANSYKEGHRCVAGKDHETFKWIRPVSSCEKGEVTLGQISYSSGGAPELLDIIEILFKEKSPEFYQPENILIAEQKWKNVGKYPGNELDKLCDNPDDIWIHEGDRCDRVSENYLQSSHVSTSLFLIQPTSLKIERRDRVWNDEVKKKVRAVFDYNGMRYDFGITDPFFHEKYRQKEEGIYKVPGKAVYLCVSLGGPFLDGFCYKIAAAIIVV